MRENEKSFDILVALDVCVDIILSGDVVPEFGQKEKLIDDYFLEMGGSNCIFACQASKLGLNVAGVGRCGQDALGVLVADTLERSGVNVEHVTTAADIKTAIGVALCKDDDRAILTYLGTIAAQGLEQDLNSLINNTRHLHIGSYYLLKQLQSFYPDLLVKAKLFGVTVSLDTNWDPEEKWQEGLSEILPFVDVFMPNENELLAISGESDFSAACEKMGRIVKVVVVKRGSSGAAAYTLADGLIEVTAIDVDYVDSIGAGDSFDGGFLYGYLNGANLFDCLQFGVICGSMNTRGRGGVASQITESELQKVVADIS